MKRGLLLIPFLLSLLTGCLKDDTTQGTIVLMGTEADVKPVEEVIPDTLLAFITDPSVMGDDVIDLPTGCTPPDIQGEYLFCPRELFHDNGHQPVANDTLFFRFDGQHNRIAPGDLREKGFSQRHIHQVYVMGNGNDFTAYFTVKYDDCYEPMSQVEFSLTRGYILTGTVTSTGIDHAVVACVNIAVEPNSPSQYVSIDALKTLENRIYIYRIHSDDPAQPYGSAIKQQWY